MAKLSAFKIDARACRDGEFVSLGAEFGGMEIKTRALTDAYSDAIAARLRQAARSHQGRTEQVPIAEVRRIRFECLRDHVWCGELRGAENDDGTPAAWADMLAIMEDPSGIELFEAAAAAPLRVGARQADDLRDAVGNSPTPSAIISPGADTPDSSTEPKNKVRI